MLYEAWLTPRSLHTAPLWHCPHALVPTGLFSTYESSSFLLHSLVCGLFQILHISALIQFNNSVFLMTSLNYKSWWTHEELTPALCDKLGMRWGGRWAFKREGTYVPLRLIHADVQQKPTQYCKARVLQLKIYLKKNLMSLPGILIVKIFLTGQITAWISRQHF